MAGASDQAQAPLAAGFLRRRWRPLAIAFWTAPVLAFFVFSDRRPFLSQVFIYGLLALSLDLMLGYAGILSLGHAAFFGCGAYTAGLLARHGWPEPISGLLAAGLIAGGLGYVSSYLVVSGADLTRLMITLGLGLLTFEAANQASSLTGGVDGLSDMQEAKLFGRLSFGLDGTTAFVYSFIVLAVVFAIARRVVASPFGLSLRGIRENARRMPAIGADVPRRLRTIFAISAATAGIAGALLAQTTRFVGIDTLGFQRSADVLVILAFGGTGRLYGALLGAAVFILAQDMFSGISPEYWQFWLGAVLVLLVLLVPGGLTGALDRLQRWFEGRVRS